MKNPQIKKIDIIAFSSHGQGLSGGDRIWIEFAKQWGKKHRVHIFTWSEGKAMFDRQKNKKNHAIVFHVFRNGWFKKRVFVLSYIARIIGSILWSLSASKTEVIYSASEFWMDVFPAAILKLKNPSMVWIATWFQTAPNPIKGYQSTFSVRALLYWLMQQPSKLLIGLLADWVLVNNETERQQFPKLDQKGFVIVVLGAVDTKYIQQWINTHPNHRKKYDAVFQGRFHPQKGVQELIGVWNEVVKSQPKAVLVMIGDGPLMSSVKQLIKQYQLEKNIKLVGYLFDGDEKYKLFSQSKMVLHPALYDSGGMASYEAMAFGLPVIGFDLPAYTSYYPKGMIKVPVSHFELYANKILEFLTTTSLSQKIGAEAKKYVFTQASWHMRADMVLKKILV
jgi:glycosyltransferase involved in cell wall biosynthesis